MPLQNALLLLTVEIAVIIAASRLLGVGFRRLQQPQVIGEILAGILLGPSFLGWVAPEMAATLFPPQALPSLKMLSEYGVLFFMFLVGLELDPTLLRGRGHAAVVISHVSIIAPFFLGALLALFLYTRLSSDAVPFTNFALFLGAAMSITAFPVLARILIERDLLKTKVGLVSVGLRRGDSPCRGTAPSPHNGGVGAALYQRHVFSGSSTPQSLWLPV